MPRLKNLLTCLVLVSVFLSGLIPLRALADEPGAVQFIVQPASPAPLESGTPLVLSATTTSSSPVAYQWLHNGRAISGANATTFQVGSVSLPHAGLYSLRATNTAGVYESAIALVVVIPSPGSPASDFADAASRPNFVPVSGQAPRALAPAPGGGMYVGGSFASLDGSTQFRHLVRVFSDGRLDTSFNPAPNGSVEALLALPDGDLLVGGAFTEIAGQPALRFARLHADGTLDTDFLANLNAAGPFLNNTTSPAANTITRIARLSDGRIVIAGGVSGQAAPLHLISPSGVRDLGFSSAAAVNNVITALAVQSDDKILIGGSFSSAGGSGVSRLARLFPTGSRDTSFAASVTSSTFRDLVVDGTNRIFASGSFFVFSGTPPFGVFALGHYSNTGAFTAVNLASANIFDLQPDPQGRLLFLESNSVARLVNSNPPSTPASLVLDPSFNRFVVSGQPGVVSLTDNETIWLGGGFTQGLIKLTGNRTDTYLVNTPVRVDANAGSTARFWVGALGTGLSYQWFKGDVPLADIAGRITGSAGPVLTVIGVSASDDAFYSVRVSGGSPVSTVTSPPVKLNLVAAPVVAVQPSAPTPAFGSTIRLAADVLAATPATYVWRRDGILIQDGGRYSGASTGTLTIASANDADNGSYTLTVTNALGVATTTPAIVTVAQIATARDPATAAIQGGAFVNTVLHLPDGRLLIGAASSVSGAASTSVTSQLALVGTDGRVSLPGGNTFGGGAQGVTGLRRLADGRLLVIGSFQSINSTAGPCRTRLSRLLPDFSIDPSFSPVPPYGLPTGVWGDVWGRTYVAGEYQNSAGTSEYKYLVRLLPDGSLDATFKPSLNGPVNTLTPTADGGFIVGGDFTAHGPGAGQAARGLLRFDREGRVDSTFSTSALPLTAKVSALTLDPQERLLVAIRTPSRELVRLLASGQLDPTFSVPANTFVSDVLTLHVLPDSRVLIGSSFTSPAQPLIALLPHGALDPAFDLGSGFGNIYGEGHVRPIATGADGRIWIGGDFNTYQNVAAFDLVVLQGKGPVLAFRAQPGAQAVNAGASVTFSAPATGNNGFTYLWKKDGVPLVDGVRVAGAATSTLMLHNVSAGDEADYSVTVTSPSGSLTSVSAPLIVFTGPRFVGIPSDRDRVVDLGFATNFDVSVFGPGSRTYQWLFNGVPLADSATMTGSGTAVLNLAKTAFNQAGLYRLRVTEISSGALIDSPPFRLTVRRRPGAVAAEIEPPSLGSAFVKLLLALPDGSTLIAGEFPVSTESGEMSRPGLARILSNGSRDSAFAPQFGGEVTALELDSNGRLYVGGEFSSVTISGITYSRSRVVRFTPALGLDTAFIPSSGAIDFPVTALAPAADGSVLVGGYIAAWDSPISPLVRLNPSGVKDPAFNASVRRVLSLARLSDGKIYVGGYDDVGWGDGTIDSLILLNSDGTRDPAFSFPGTVFDSINRIQILPAGNLLVAGSKSGADYLRRLNPDTGGDLGLPDLGGLQNSSYRGITGFAFDNANRVVVLNSDGELWRATEGIVDATFDLNDAIPHNSYIPAQVRAVAIDAAGRIHMASNYGYQILNGRDLEIHDGRPSPQSILFAPLPDRLYSASANTVPLLGVASSDLPVTFTVNSGPATLAPDGVTLLLSGVAGTVSVTATQPGDADYSPAVPVMRSFSVGIPNGYETYLIEAGVPLSSLAADSDPDGDGVPNLVEYALGLEPLISGTTGLPEIQVAGSDLSLSYLRLRSDVSYEVETTTNLSNPSAWTTEGVDQGAPDAAQRVTASVSLSPSPRFLRLRVTLLP